MEHAYDNTSPLTPAGAPERDLAHYSLTAEQVSDRFAEAGVPRSVRSIQRFCQKGHLSCTAVDTEVGQKYLIDPDSVDRRIRELQQIERMLGANPGAPRRDETRHDATGRDTSRHDAPRDATPDGEHTKALEEKIRSLEIDKAVRQQLIDRMDDDRKRMLDQIERFVLQLTEKSRTIGQLETKVAYLEAPRASEPETLPDAEEGRGPDPWNTPPAFGDRDQSTGDNSFGGQTVRDVQ